MSFCIRSQVGGDRDREILISFAGCNSIMDATPKVLPLLRRRHLTSCIIRDKAHCSGKLSPGRNRIVTILPTLRVFASSQPCANPTDRRWRRRKADASFLRRHFVGPAKRVECVSFFRRCFALGGEGDRSGRKGEEGRMRTW